MKKKIIVGVLLLNLLGFAGCLNCDQYRYYDFTGIEIDVRNPVVAANDSLWFGYKATGTNYLSQRNFNGFLNTAYAFSCDKGFDGPKFPPVRIDVTSDTNFDAAHPAGTLLNDIVKVYGDVNANSNQQAYGYLNQFDASVINFYFMYLTAKPENDLPHHFTIEVEKSNGQIYSDTSPAISWE